jgi:hypothetical protein
MTNCRNEDYERTHVNSPPNHDGLEDISTWKRPISFHPAQFLALCWADTTVQATYHFTKVLTGCTHLLEHWPLHPALSKQGINILFPRFTSLSQN